MSFEFFPSADTRLATRLKRQVMALMSYLMFLGPLVYSIEHGWVRFGYPGLAWFLACALLVNSSFFVLIRFGWSRRFADPSMVSAQIGFAALLALVIGYHVAAQAMVITQMLYFTAFFFGVFRFSRRQYLFLAAIAALAYLVMLLLKYDASLRSGPDFRLEMLHFMVLVVVLLWMSLLGSYVARMRSKLVDKSAALASALGRLKELASRDELTGLHNRRHLLEILGQQEERARRHGEPFTLGILDIDHFKQINDSHGHGVGDEVLKAFSERIRNLLRRMDVIGRDDSERVFGRYGGEEFLLLLPYAEGENALACLRRLHAAVQAAAFQTSVGLLDVTFSAGVAQYRAGESVGDLIQRADEALYRAKTAGRNRIEFAT